MKILIIGNIGSGKTTLGKKIQEITGYKFVQIDKLREKYLTGNSLCKVKVDGCSSTATDVHHTYAGSNRDTYYLVQSTWLPVCRNCHNWIHSNPQKARTLKYLK